MIREGLLGRYEYRDDRSDKFWTIELSDRPYTYRVTWGRNGRPPQGEKYYDEGMANHKLNEKIAKGYVLSRKYDVKIDPFTKKRTPNEDSLDWMSDLKKIAGGRK